MSEPSTPWHRQFWPWFLILVPAAAVVAGIATFILAAQGSDGLVVDDYYKVGLGINRELAREQKAAQLGLTAALRLNLARDAVEIHLQPAGIAPERLRLALRHATRAQHDRVVILSNDGSGTYRGALDSTPQGDWHVSLAPEDSAWRLRGRLRPLEHASVRLIPQQTASD